LIPWKQRVYREGFWTSLALLRLFDGSWPVLYVLGAGLKSRLLEHFPDRAPLTQLRVMEHPYCFRVCPGTESGRDKSRIGFVGTGRVVKGIEEFFAIADSLQDCVAGGALEFVVVGGMEPGAPRRGADSVTVLADRPAGLDSEAYFDAIGALDCALFVGHHDYSLTASGAIFDVIGRNVEVFSLRNQYLHDLSRLDVERGIKFFGDVNAISAEIRNRIVSGVGFRRYGYPLIKEVHSTTGQRAVAEGMVGR
jgi:hypothetical protein